MRRWTIVEDKRLRQMAARGATCSEIAISLGRTEFSVYGRARYDGLSLSAGPEPENRIQIGAWVDKDQARRLRARAAELGISTAELVRRIFKTALEQHG